MNKLKPCPFCGRKVTIYYVDSFDSNIIDCDCGCSYGNGMDLTVDELTKLWNTRKNEESEEEE